MGLVADKVGVASKSCSEAIRMFGRDRPVVLVGCGAANPALVPVQENPSPSDRDPVTPISPL